MKTLTSLPTSLPMKNRSTLALGSLFVALAAMMVCVPGPALAASFFVQDTLRDASVNPKDARAATALIRNAVVNRGGDFVVQDEARASFVLQPRLIRVGQNYILTIEKIRGQETLFAAQSRLATIDDLDRAAFSATKQAIEEPVKNPSRNQAGRTASATAYDPSAPYDSDHDRFTADQDSRRDWNLGSSASATTQSASEENYQAPLSNSIQNRPPAPATASTATPTYDAGRTNTRAVDVIPKSEVKGRQWMVGFGPFLSRRLSSDVAMYNGMFGHKWNLNPRASIKAMGEIAFSSGKDRAQMYNVAAGGNYYLPGDDDTALYFTGDMGYGVAQNATGETGEGFSAGGGAGVEFFRTTQTTLDVLLRYAVIFDNTSPGSGNPAIVGARVAVNF